eukprot:TRINITY_DN1368_c1_g1_i5.p1 TRINITY_DN1368_c1_g1~~TRINITY_DN1368_c1_g1_i5.p1  ORF type:complete len:888 (-),score=216.70 TRINITY_DN1368_c1_g1_i5:193-2550(-)
MCLLWKKAMSSRLDRAQAALETIQKIPARSGQSNQGGACGDCTMPGDILSFDSDKSPEMGAQPPPDLPQGQSLESLMAESHTQSAPSGNFTVSQLKAFQKLNETFRLPADEVHLFDHPAALWCGKSFKFGHLFISRRFMSFVSSRSSRSIFLSIPFRIVSSFVEENGISGVRTTAIKIIVRNRKYMMTADHRSKLVKRLEDRRCRLQVEEDLLPFIKVPEINTAGGEGFGSALLSNSQHFSTNYLQKQHFLHEQWNRYRAKFGIGLCMIEDREHMRRLLMAGGIPDKLRPSLWVLLSGAFHMCLAQETPNLYCEILAKHADTPPPVAGDIEKDLIRSFPEHPFFQTEAGIRSLRQVLTAYAWKNPKIGYCQSMNIVTAFLLVYMPEHWAFFVLSCICEALVPENYSSSMIGSIVDQSIFEKLLSAKVPRIADHVKELGVPIGVITHGWFLCLFIGYLPLELCLQTLDVFFFIGRNWLYSVGIAIFKLHEQDILAADSPEDVIMMLKKVQANGHDLLKLGFRYLDAINQERIEEIRNTERSRVIEGLEQNNRDGFVREIMDRGTKFTEKELERIFNAFMENIAPDGMRITKDRFHEVVEAAVPAWEFRSELSDRLFLLMDEEGAGKLSFERVVAGLERVAKAPLRNRMELIFRLHDEDHDGKLDKGDYYCFLDAVARSYFNSPFDIYVGDVSAVVGDTFEEGDRDQDGLVELADVILILIDHESEHGKERRRLVYFFLFFFFAIKINVHMKPLPLFACPEDFYYYFSCSCITVFSHGSKKPCFFVV